MIKHRSLGRALGVALLATSAGACSDFISVEGGNPNAVPKATADQLFVGAQVNTFMFSESQVARISSMWLQQMAGTDRQFQGLDIYSLRQSDADGEFSQIYAQGGLLDIRQAQELTKDRKVYLGILKIHEAYLIGMGASIWGDIPYTAAADPENPGATLDPQEQVYAAVQALLDGAIADLQAGTGSPAGADVNFGGKAANWIAVANTLKARFYMHWVEAQEAGSAAANTACGGNCLDKALAAARNGIQTASGNWYAVHGAGAKENNLWYQFMRDRSGYIAAGAFGVDLLQDRGDPRLSIYYSKGQAKDFADVYIGSPPGNPSGDPGAGASSLSTTGYGSPTFDIPIATSSENAFIIAEASYHKGLTAQAQAALAQGVAQEEARLNVKGIPTDATLTGSALLDEIMTQKYAALFLNMEAWNDYKRTCLPAIQTYQGNAIPARLFYGETEAQTNPNIPAPDKQKPRNTNDPQGGLSGKSC